MSGEHEEESGHDAGQEGEGRVDVFIVFTGEDGVVRMDERLSVRFVMDTLRRHFCEAGGKGTHEGAGFPHQVAREYGKG